MSRITRWKIEKTKVKVVFRLQFHATHIPQTGWDKLYISFIPADSGKATMKTTKANVRNGTCKWADPIYETTRLLQDIKTKEYDEKLYKLVVAMGSSRSSLLGEAVINLADYADATKPSAVALPLHGCDSGAILHVTVQLLTSKTGFREFEQQREIRERGLQIGADLNNADQPSIGNVSEDIVNNQMDKVNSRVRFKGKSRDRPLLEEDAGLNGECADSAVGFDGSSNTSESLCAEKNDISSTHEVDSLKSTVSGELVGLVQSPQQEKGDPSDHRYLALETNDLVHGWSSDFSVDNDLTNTYEENNRLRGCLEMAESSIHELKVEVCSLQNHADELSAETQKFSQQLVAEIASGEQLAKEVSVLKSECSKLKDDLERMRNKPPSFAGKEVFNEQDHLFRDLEVTFSKAFLVMEEKIMEVQNRACLGFHDRDIRFLNSELEALLGILHNLKEGTGKALSGLSRVPTEGCNTKETREMSLHKKKQYLPVSGFDSELYQPELGLLPQVSIPGLVLHETDSIDAASAMKEKIFELLRELDESKAERESLAKKMDQMECYYEALVQELEENQRQMLGELQNLRNEHSSCLYRTQSTKAEIETMHRDMNEQVLKYAEEKQDLEALNKELERRAVIAEAALKRARLNYSIAVDQLQKDLELLSFQVLSMFETNENLIRQAFVDSSQPSSQGYPEMMQNQKLNSNEFHATKLLQCQNQFVEVKKQQSGGDTLLEDLKRSLHLQEGLYQKVEEEVCEVHLVNIYLDVFSKALQETLVEVHADVRHMKERIEELTQQLELSVESKGMLVLRLQTAMDDVHSLNEYKSTCIAKCNDMALQRQILEENLEDVNRENHLLTQKINELEPLIVEYKSCKSKYDACTTENIELTGLLKEKTRENGFLQNNISSLQEELTMVKADFDELCTVKKNIQGTVDFVQNRLWNLLSSSGKLFDGLPLQSESAGQDLESKDLAVVVADLEKLQTKAYENILQLLKEKKDIMDERDRAQVSLSMLESDMVVMKQAFEHEVRNIVDRLDMYNVSLQKLHSEIEAFAEKFKIGTEIEENFAEKQKELLSDLEHLELELHQLTSKNRELAQEILELESVNEELGISKLNVAELTEGNKSLMRSLQEKSEESSKLALEVNSLKESLQSIHSKLQAERSSKDKFESMVTELTSQMNERHCQLVQFEQQKSELVHLKQIVADLESEKSELCRILLHAEESLKNAREESSSITPLESQLSEMHEFSIAADVNLIFIRTQYEAWSEDLVKQLSFSKRQLAELEKNHLDMESVLNGHLACEAHLSEENDRLLTSLDSLKSELEASISQNSGLLDANSTLTAREAHLCEENVRLLTSLDSLKFELEASISQNSALLDANSSITAREAHLSEENVRLLSSLDSLKSELEAAISQNSVILDANSTATACEARLSGENVRLMTSLNSIKSELEASNSQNNGLLDANSTLMAREAHLSEENARLLTSLDSIKSELEASISQNSVLLDANGTMKAREAQLNEENMGLLTSIDSLKSELEASISQNSVTLDANSLATAREAQLSEENARLLISLESQKSELEAFVSQNRVLLDATSSITAELDEYKKKVKEIELSYYEDKRRHALEVKRLKHLLVSSQGEIDNLMVLKEELEVNVLVLKSKLDEQRAEITLLEGFSEEVMQLQNRCNGLSQKLSEQIMKTEEFKNLSIHLKELKDKADAECVQAREKRESEGPPTVMQESLRIAFIKEQYETRLQELKHQLAVSKKHSEEMLWKLQDAIDEIENRKKSEASHLKRNEELGVKILELEAELQSVVSDRREKVKGYDLLKAELDCSMISLECCKEEKQKLEAALQECNDEKSKISDELSMVKKLLETSTSAINGSSRDPGLKYSDQDSSVNCEEVEHACSVSMNDSDGSNALMNLHPEQDLLSSDDNGVRSLAPVNQQTLLNRDGKHLALINDQFKTQSLRSSMDHLNSELERMKNDNLVLSQDDYQLDPESSGIQRELMRLQKVNEELGSIFPLFNEYSGSGNALERVLALEIELAEALQNKKKSSIHFQSSFLKQRSDEEAVFKSFRDINELIKDTLELKGRYSAVETELKEMHGRYSELSLQFAEVEGERQKLMMTIKNLRATKKAQLLNRSSSATLGEQP